MSTDIKNFNNGLDVDGVADTVAKEHNGELVKEFFEEVGKAEFLVPHRDNVNTIPLLNIEGKGKMLPVFSSFGAFEKSPLPKDKAKIMPFSKIDEIVRASAGQIAGIIINPHGKSMIFQHNGAKAPEANPGGIKLMKAASVPENIVAVLKNYFSECENVYAAYVLWAQKENDLAPHLFLVIDFDGKKEEFFPNVANAIRPCLKTGDNVEMAKADFKLLKAAEKLAVPIYKKS